MAEARSRHNTNTGDGFSASLQVTGLQCRMELSNVRRTAITEFFTAVDMLQPVCTKHLQSVCRARARRPVEQVLNAGPALRSRLGAQARLLEQLEHLHTTSHCDSCCRHGAGMELAWSYRVLLWGSLISW